jgi:tetratricopeptide (TPR) repeat protein
LQRGAALLDAAIAELEEQSPDSPALIECLEQKSDLDLTLQDVASSVATARASVAQAQRLFPRAKFHEISPRVQLATALRAAGELQVADRMLRETLDLLRELGRERTVDAVLLYNTWGTLKSDIGDIAGAARLIESGLEIGRAQWVDAAPDQYASVNYARRLVVLNRLDEAEHYFSNALPRSGDEDDAEMEAQALLGLVAVKRARGDLVGARAARDRADQFIRTHMPPEHRARVVFLFESGLLDLADNSLLEAKVRLEQALFRYQRANMRVPDQVVALASLARCELALGEPHLAARFADDASTLAEKFAVPGLASYWLGFSLLAQVDVERALGHAALAQALSVKALAQLTPTVGADHPLTKRAAALAKMASLPAGFR